MGRSGGGCDTRARAARSHATHTRARDEQATILFGSQVGSEIGTLGSAIAWVSEESLW